LQEVSLLALLIETERGSAEVPLRDGQTVMGRGEDCNLIVNDGLLSRRHVCFKLDNEGFSVEDLGSTNGVYVNGRRISGKARLAAGDLILVGSSKLRVEQRRESAYSPPRSSSQAGPPVAELERAKSRASVTARPPPGRPEADATGVARRSQVLDLLAGLATKALGQGRPEQAEQLLSPVLHQFLGDAKSKRALPANDAERVCGHALRLAAATGKGEWINYVIELYAVEPKPLPGTIIDELLTAVRKVPKVDVNLLRLYLDALRSSADALSAGDRFLLQRLETFERVAAAR
jgi:pSer/pThr/pTyr-binding forkhead associated (FHA) protein